MPKKGGGGKKKKGKGPAMETSDDALAPFNLKFRDMVSTPLGVIATVAGTKDGSLYLEFPGKIISAATCAPQRVKDQTGMEAYGYTRRPQSAHIQRSVDEREEALYQHRRYGKPAPKTAQFRLPLGPHGADGAPKFQAYNQELANPGSIIKPGGGGDNKKKK